MLEVFINFICAFMLALLGFHIIKKIIDSDIDLDIKSIFVLALNSFIIAVVHNMEFSSLLPMINFIVNAITYKIIFKITIEDAFLVTGILSLYILVADIVFVGMQALLISTAQIKNNIYLYLLINICVTLIALIASKIKIISNRIKKYYKILSAKNLHLNIIFICLLIITSSVIIYNISLNYKVNVKFINDIILIVSMVIIGIIFINNKDTYNKLSDEYDILLKNVTEFEEWIEKEQFIRHEYKNQLAFLYSLTSEKKVKCKIEEIISYYLNIKDSNVYNLKALPKGGLKGLMYYKTIIAQNSKINLTIDVSLKEKGILSKLSDEDINTLSKVLGILYDNAIEAAKESRKKLLLLEIYELKDTVNIVISNTFKKDSLLSSRNKKGISSKGTGRGYGLYFATKIISKNKWLEEKNEIIDNHYIETITINKKHF